MLNSYPSFELKNIKYFFFKNKNQSIDFLNTSKYLYGFLSFSSWSIALIVYWRIRLYNKEKNINILIPKFYCDNALRFVRKIKNISIHYYDVDNNLYYDPSDIEISLLKNKIDIFINVNYFNLIKNSNNKIYEFCKSKNIWTISDCTHCLNIKDNIKKKDDFYLFSPYKFLSIPNGAILILNKNNQIFQKIKELKFDNPNIWSQICKKIAKQNNIHIQNSYYSYYRWIFKIILNTFSVYRTVDVSTSESNLNKNKLFSPKISFVSKQIILKAYEEYNNIRYKRDINYYFLCNIIENIIYYYDLNCKIVNQTNICKYLVIINGSGDSLKRLSIILKKKRISSYYWPDFPSQNLLNFSSALKLKSSYLYVNFNHTIKNSIFVKLFKKNLISKSILSKYETNIPQILKIDKNEYKKNYLLLEKNNFINSPFYLEIKKKLNNVKINYYKININDETVAILSNVERNFLFIKIIVINRGPLFINDKVNKSIIYDKIFKIGNFKKFKFLFFFSDMEVNKYNSKILLYNRAISYLNNSTSQVILSLNKDVDVIKSNFDQKWRNCLNKSLKSDLDVKFYNNQSNLNDLIKNYNTIKAKKNFEGIKSFYLKNFNTYKNKDEYYLIISAYKNNYIVSQICIFIHGANATYLVGINKSNGRKYNANYLLLWKAIIKLKELNIKYFDLGGISYNNKNIYNFKKGINAKIYETFGLSIKY